LLSDIDEVIQAKASDAESSCDSAADAIAQVVMDCHHWPSSNDAYIIFYINGAIARTIVRSTKCDHCRE
jgi:hypothetical protein